MVVLRLLGLWLFLFALVCLAIDGTKSLAAEELIITSLEEMWIQLHSVSFEALQTLIQANLYEFVQDPILAFIFSLPVWAIFAVLGTFLYWLGKKRIRTSVYIN